MTVEWNVWSPDVTRPLKWGLRFTSSRLCNSKYFPLIGGLGVKDYGKQDYGGHSIEMSKENNRFNEIDLRKT